MKRITCSSSFNLAMPPEQAIALFTPEGERLWAGDEWDPNYPVALAADADGAEPGTVFTTGAEDASTIWVGIVKTESMVTYGRVTPGVAAGLVSVSCVAVGDRETKVEVVYDASSLSEQGEAFLTDFESGYSAFIASWEKELHDAIFLEHL
jgi:hypothetical protein